MAFVVPLLIVLFGILAFFYVRNHEMSSMIWNEVRSLAGDSDPQPATVTDPAALPAALRRYLAFAIDGDMENMGFVRLRHGGDFRLRPGDPWLAISGEEYFHGSEPGFVWTGKVTPSAMSWVRARDRYIHGEGQMLIRLRGAVTVGDSRGPEMDRSSLLRYLAEMPWFPTAFRSVSGLTWREVDEHTLEATLTHGGHSVKGRFTFNAGGEITGFESGERYREVDGKWEQQHWSGSYSAYHDVGGFRIPQHAEVSWGSGEQLFTYARFDIEEIDYNVPAPF